MIDVVLGCDLSLSAAGFVAVPPDWSGEWERIARHHVGHSLPRDVVEMRRVGRLHQITAEAVAFSERHGCRVACFEHYAFGAQFERERLGEIGGAVKLALVSRAGILDVETVASNTARKLLLGKVPKKDPKAHVREALLALGMPRVWTDDEVDALVAANWLRHQRGAFAFVGVGKEVAA